MPYPFDATMVTRFTNQGETQYSDEHPFLVDRAVVAIVAGTATYTLSDYVKSIRRVTFLGTKLDPLPQRNHREVFQAGSQTGTPYWYIFNNVGINKIQLFPTPNVSYPSVAGSVWGAGIPLMCIIEFWRISDNSSFVIPSWNRSQMLKHYLNRQSYSVDGQGQNLKASKYFGERWDQEREFFTGLMEDLHSRPRRYCLHDFGSSGPFPGAPVLDGSRYGQGVDAGE